MKKIKKRWLILAVIVMLLLAAWLFVTNGLTEGRNVPLYGVNLADKPDGDYQGVYNFKRWNNTVLVHVEDHRIIGIDIVDDVGAEGITQCANEMFRRVIDAQNTIVDTVSGATVTSKAYLKAIEDALK